LKNFIDEFKFSFRVDSKERFTNLFSKNWASLCIPLISEELFLFFPSSSRKNLRLGSRGFILLIFIFYSYWNHYRYKTPC
jgi:hypothetical protein